MRREILWLITFLALLTTPLLLPAQIKGKITDKYSGLPVPFVHILTDGGTAYVSDIDGNFLIRDSAGIHRLTFRVYEYRPLDVRADTISGPLNITLSRYHYFFPDDCSSDTALRIMEQVLKHKKDNEISRVKYVRYATYNKATFTPGKVDLANRSLGKAFDLLSLKFNTFKPNQHFLILESVTDRKVYNRHHFKEVIQGAKSTIVDVPSLFMQTTQLQAFSAYDDYINVGGRQYVSPLANRTFSRYAFNITDTLLTMSDTIYAVKFNPLAGKNFDGLKGFLFINSKNYAVQFFQATPAHDSKIKMTALQSYAYYPYKRSWFPERTKTMIETERWGEKFLINFDSYISHIDLDYISKKKDYDEVILYYPPYANTNDTVFWKEKRFVPLTLRDSVTYVYYDSADLKKKIQRTIKLGEDLYYGYVPYKMVDLELKRFLDFNQLEGTRLGFGGHTNKRFSDRHVIGAYVGFGTLDKAWKYGVDYTYKLKYIPVSFQTSLIDDVKEAGTPVFPFNKPQYSSETLRRLKLRIMDRVQEWENAALLHPARYLDARIALSISRNKPTYDYQFRDLPSDQFQFTELKAGFRYAYGEQFIELPDRKISVATPFPVFYFNYTKGFRNFLQGQYDYMKYDFKAEFNFKVLDIGRTGVQLAAGLVQGAVPYGKLYNMMGSYKSFSPVIHNSFETMRYNEFLSDRYIALFLSHDLGRIYFGSRLFRPTLLLIHNTGIGTLSHREYQKIIPFKTMEKGYIESGFLLDNLVVLKIGSLKAGIGPGFFLRYGPYAYSTFGDNFVVKLATKFTL